MSKDPFIFFGTKNFGTCPSCDGLNDELANTELADLELAENAIFCTLRTGSAYAYGVGCTGVGENSGSEPPNTFKKVPIPEPVVSVRPGKGFTSFLLSNGHVFIAGGPRGALVPVLFSEAHVQAHAAYKDSYVQLTDNEIVFWPEFMNSQKVSFPLNTRVIAISCGNRFATFITEEFFLFRLNASGGIEPLVRFDHIHDGGSLFRAHASANEYTVAITIKGDVVVFGEFIGEKNFRYPVGKVLGGTPFAFENNIVVVSPKGEALAMGSNVSKQIVNNDIKKLFTLTNLRLSDSCYHFAGNSASFVTAKHLGLYERCMEFSEFYNPAVDMSCYFPKIEAKVEERIN